MNAHRKLYTVTSILAGSLAFAACARGGDSPDPSTDPSSDPGTSIAISEEGTGVHVNAITEAPTGFDSSNNGFCASQAAMDEARGAFETVETFDDGIGPVFNNTSCVSCHQNPFTATGAGSQITELRAGHFNGITFTDHPGGSLINDRATDRSIQEHILSGNEVRTLRLTLSTTGDGYVESIDSNTLVAISNAQPAGQRGTVIQVAVLEAGGATRVGRFGWKNQNASLLSFSADAYLNEMGITNRLLRTENTSNGNNVQGGPFDGSRVEPGATEDDADNDIDEFAEFMRCQKAPPRGPITAQVQTGQQVFTAIGCAVCHTATITTAPAGTVINAGQFTVPTALGDKNIHPFGDFLLHDVGTGDGIVQNGGQGTRNQVRTAPLWGIGARTRFMHDGASVTASDAIARHGNQAATARNNFNGLSAANQAAVLAFIFSL
jgi:CxxC motif-containing protein (DUF1111 family)